MRDLTDLPAELQHLLAAWLDGLDAVLGPRLHSAYMYGSWVFPGRWVQDVDADAIVDGPFDDDDRASVREMLTGLAAMPLGDDMDVWYIDLAEARGRSRPQTQLRPGYRSSAWALHRAHIHAGRYIALRGPDPTTFVPDATWSELDESLQDELDGAEEAARGKYGAYGVLNGCRVLWSYTSRDVVASKLEASDWALSTVPAAWHPVIRAAQRRYDRTDDDADRTAVADGAMPFVSFVRERVARLRG